MTPQGAKRHRQNGHMRACPRLSTQAYVELLAMTFLCWYSGAQQVLCPNSAPCACPTRGSGGANYACYSPSQYHCTSANPANGLVQGSGTSTVGSCVTGILTLDVAQARQLGPAGMQSLLTPSHVFQELLACFIILFVSGHQTRNVHLQ